DYGLDEPLQPEPARRAYRLLLVLVLVLALTAITRLAGSAERHRAQLAAPPSATVPSRLPVTSGLTPASPTPGPGIAVPSCPSTITCAHSTLLPPQLIAAVRQYLPGTAGYRTIAVAQTDPLRVYFRRLDVTSGPVKLTVRLTQSDIMDGLESTSYTRSADGRTTSFVRLITAANYDVTIQAQGPARRTPSVAMLRSLAADLRLLALA
ncbi:MAG: hypothetical protein ABI429_08780, partial [Jatrophihabitantaceae bacterium]